MDTKALTSIADKVKNSTSILVTVSSSPSVDALSAAIGLTIMLNTLGKHVTAIFSGAVPPAITFLDPNSTFENNVDSLRDFIIALDKEKADHLRYKVEGDVVKIFITPYRTTIGADDLQFSQGDYNVELVLALGVSDQAHLDAALEAHGQIFHDATVATIGLEPSSLGSIDWQNPQASSLSEMVTDLGDAIKGDASLIDNQVATALLTGIVAATDRFSNKRTNSRSMTLGAQLMAAGADQQLIAAKLQANNAIDTPAAAASSDAVSAPGASDFAIVHDKNATLADIEKVVKAEEGSAAPSTPAPATTLPTPSDTAAPAEPAIPAESTEPTEPVEPLPNVTENDVPTAPVVLADAYKIDPSEPALSEPTHGYLGETPAGVPPMSGATTTDTPPVITEPTAPENAVADSATSVTIMPPVAGDAGAASNALADAHAAIGTPPATPAATPFALPQPPPLPDFSTMMPGAAPAPVTPPERLGDILAPETPAPVTPDAPQAGITPPAASDPGQFKIPGSSV